jgi:hypothetical protein
VKKTVSIEKFMLEPELQAKKQMDKNRQLHSSRDNWSLQLLPEPTEELHNASKLQQWVG